METCTKGKRKSEADTTEKKTLIAIPTMDFVAAPFCFSLANMRRIGHTKIAMISNSLIYHARNMLAAQAIEDGCDYVLWLDSDMAFDSGLMERLHADMLQGYDFVSALYFKRLLPTEPVIYREGGGVYTDYPQDQIFRIGGAGFGACMMRTEMIANLYNRYGPPFNPLPDGTGEDVAFCRRAIEAGYELYCDSRIKVKHAMNNLQIGEEHYKREKNG